MLKVGLTGGIGAGKSAVAARLAELGATIIDADRLAREVVAPGTDGLREIEAAFGPGVIAPDGSLDRTALGARVFGADTAQPPGVTGTASRLGAADSAQRLGAADSAQRLGAADSARRPGAADTARRTLESIIHPRVRARTAELTAAAPPDAIVVNDVPLLVEAGLAPTYHLVIVVDAPESVRVERLVRTRGMSPDEARARIGAQATDDQRRAVADATLSNTGSLADLRRRVDALWHERLRPYEENLRCGRVAAGVPDPQWSVRIAARARHAGGELVAGVEPDGAEIVLALAPGADAAELAERLAAAGLPADGPGRFGSADPGQPARIRVA